MARGALEKHQQLLDASLSAVEAAAARVAEAVSQKKLLESEHGDLAKTA